MNSLLLRFALVLMSFPALAANDNYRQEWNTDLAPEKRLPC